MSRFTNLQRKMPCLPLQKCLRWMGWAYLVVIAFGFSSCANSGGAKTGETSYPQTSALKHSPPLPLGTSNRPAIKNWALVFHDEFNDAPLDTGVWNIEDYGKNRYQNCCLYFGSQYFTSQALAVHNGDLRITSDKRASGNENYTSGGVTTENKFSFIYGRVDIRARFSGGKGMWPGLWMLTADAGHEVDIMEMVNDPTIVYQTYHLNIPTYNTAVPQCVITRQDLSDAFHVFSLIWDVGSLTWYIDGMQTCHITYAVPTTPMYLLLDVAVGGSWPGSPSLHTSFPRYTLIDYVRVYQKSASSLCYGLQVTSPLQLADTTIPMGATLAGKVTYTNRCTAPFTFLDLLIAARTPDGRNADFGNKGQMTVWPGESVTIDSSRLIDNSSPGIGYAFSSFESSDGKWHSDGTNLVNFTVTP